MSEIETEVQSSWAVPNNGTIKNGRRDVQVKAAVTPTEKVLFEALAKSRNKTLSNIIRDFLLKESRTDGII